MASFRTEELLTAIAEAYELAIQAFHADDLEQVRVLLESVDKAQRNIAAGDESDDPADAILLTRISEAHAALCTLTKQSMQMTQGNLQRSRDGRRALAGYGGRGVATGHRHDSDV